MKLRGEEATECWRKLHNEVLHDMYCSPNMTTVINGKKEKHVGQVACMGEKRTVYTVLVEKIEGKRNTEDLGVDGSITVNFILNTTGTSGLGLVWFEIGSPTYMAYVKNWVDCDAM